MGDSRERKLSSRTCFLCFKDRGKFYLIAKAILIPECKPSVVEIHESIKFIFDGHFPTATDGMVICRLCERNVNKLKKISKEVN
jgi:hypothetical protein